MSKVDLKVVLLGKEFGGKTSLVERYVHKRFTERTSANPYQATIGAAYASNKVTIDGRTIVIGIWDTAGSERFESMSKMYYRNARAAIICFDLTDDTSFERVKFWVSELNSNEETCKIYLCGTKFDLINDNASVRRIDSQTVAKFGTAIGAYYTETSSKTGLNIDALFEKIAKDYVQFEMILERPDNKLSGFSGDPSNNCNKSKRSNCCF